MSNSKIVPFILRSPSNCSPMYIVYRVAIACSLLETHIQNVHKVPKYHPRYSTPLTRTRIYWSMSVRHSVAHNWKVNGAANGKIWVEGMSNGGRMAWWLRFFARNLHSAQHNRYIHTYMETTYWNISFEDVKARAKWRWIDFFSEDGQMCDTYIEFEDFLLRLSALWDFHIC